MKETTYLTLFVLCGLSYNGVLTADDEYRTSASRISDLEFKFDEFIRINEAFVPSLEKDLAEVKALRHQVNVLKRADGRRPSYADLARLESRMSELERSSPRLELELALNELAAARTQIAELQGHTNGLLLQQREMNSRLAALEQQQRRQSAPTPKANSPQLSPIDQQRFVKLEREAEAVERLTNQIRQIRLRAGQTEFYARR